MHEGAITTEYAKRDLKNVCFGIGLVDGLGKPFNMVRRRQRQMGNEIEEGGEVTIGSGHSRLFHSWLHHELRRT